MFCSVRQRGVADLDLQIREGGGHPDTEIRGGGATGLKNFFFQPFGPQFGLNITGGGPPSPLSWIHHWRERVEHRKAWGIPFKVLYWSSARVLKKTGSKGNTM